MILIASGKVCSPDAYQWRTISHRRLGGVKRYPTTRTRYGKLWMLLGITAFLPTYVATFRNSFYRAEKLLNRPEKK